MFAPRFVLSMFGALAAFAIATYFLTGSLASTAIQTLLCAVLIQVGYFLAVLFLVWREARERRKLHLGKLPADSMNDEKQASKISLRRLNRPPHFNS
ncbi:exopolysaccharide production repressor protein [Sinorhizobium fredii]|uniref:Exopolysaccharide production repressor protein ExoX n=1 Tax=Sinorhizobium fredii (strain USDA 257) TaxID=1185652 RepID=I3X264_SINF2|nr:exopolysaccharide production repressor protein [Sinorhizobium fredii]AFL49970.1 exopolysaccharide production repressor protein ExoX [Sinorhizobium fredii USDA 257]